MREDEQLRFLTPWTLLLPVEGRPVVAVVGSGGKSALLRRLVRHYRGEGMKVLWTQTIDHPPPGEMETADVSRAAGELRDLLSAKGSLFVARAPEEQEGEWKGLSPERIERLRQETRPDVVLVEAQSRSSELVRRDGAAPILPAVTHLAFVVAGLHGVGRLWSGGGAAAAQKKEESRVRSRDVIELFVGERGLLSRVPPEIPVLPFLAGLADFRDMDGMFLAVARLWDEPRVKVVLMGELVGPERIDVAEEMAASALPGGAPHLRGERIYALYPASLDESS